MEILKSLGITILIFSIFVGLIILSAKKPKLGYSLLFLLCLGLIFDSVHNTTKQRKKHNEIIVKLEEQIKEQDRLMKEEDKLQAELKDKIKQLEEKEDL